MLRELPKSSKSYQRAPRVTKELQELPKSSKSYQRAPRVTKELHELPKSSKSYQRTPRVIKELQELSKNSKSYQRAPRVTEELQELSKNSKSYQRTPRVIKELQELPKSSKSYRRTAAQSVTAGDKNRQKPSPRVAQSILGCASSRFGWNTPGGLFCLRPLRCHPSTTCGCCSPQDRISHRLPEPRTQRRRLGAFARCRVRKPGRSNMQHFKLREGTKFFWNGAVEKWSAERKHVTAQCLNRWPFFKSEAKNHWTYLWKSQKLKNILCKRFLS